MIGNLGGSVGQTLAGQAATDQPSYAPVLWVLAPWPIAGAVLILIARYFWGRAAPTPTDPSTTPAATRTGAPVACRPPRPTPAASLAGRLPPPRRPRGAAPRARSRGRRPPCRRGPSRAAQRRGPPPSPPAAR